MRGSCHCGDVRWETEAPARPVLVCRCSQCRRMSGGDWAASQVAADELSIKGEVRWFEASPEARRGFCPRCGSFLFWQPLEDGAPGPRISFAAGSIDGPSGLCVAETWHEPDPPGPEPALRGSCLCGAVTVEHPGDPGEITACHCVQCRKVSGHVPRFLDDPGRVSRVEGEVARFTSPGGAVRSFCPVCGTKAAFDGPTGLLSLHAGLFDALAAREADLHIFAAFKGDYYELPEGVPAYPEAGPG